MKTHIIYLVIIIIISSFSYCNYNAQERSHTSQLEAMNDIIRHWRDKHGVEHAEKLIVYGKVDQLQAANKNLKQELSDMNIKIKNLESFSKFNVETRYNIITQLRDSVIFDTIPVKTFHWKDPWLSLNGYFSDSLHLDYNYKDEFTLATHWQKKKLFEREKLTVTIKSSNPQSHIYQMQSYTVSPDPKKFYETRGFAFGIGLVSGLIISR